MAGKPRRGGFMAIHSLWTFLRLGVAVSSDNLACSVACYAGTTPVAARGAEHRRSLRRTKREEARTAIAQVTVVSRPCCVRVPCLPFCLVPCNALSVGSCQQAEPACLQVDAGPAGDFLLRCKTPGGKASKRGGCAACCPDGRGTS